MSFLAANIGSRLFASALCALLIAGCGGGGSSDASETRATAVFDPAELSLQTIEGYPQSATFLATVSFSGKDVVYLGLAEQKGLVVDGDANVSGQTLLATLQLSSSLPPGVYSSDVLLLVCADEMCKEQLPGSPIHLPLRYEVLPQIKIEAPAPVRRVGQVAAPAQSLAAVIPARAGEVTINVQGQSHAFGVELQGDRLVIQPRQVPAGTYSAKVELRGGADPRYRASVDLDYVVEAPAGGERPLRLTPESMNIYAVQGTRTSYRFKVDRPTWTDALDPLTIVGDTVVTDLRLIGNDEYEFTVDTVNVPQVREGNTGVNDYFSNIIVRAGDYGGQLNLPIQVVVNAPVVLGNPTLGGLLNATTTLAELRQSTSVAVPDGAAVRWSASSDQAWLRTTRSSGLTGVDELQLEIDLSVLDRAGIDQVARLSVSIDRPGTLPVVTNVGVRNLVPRFDTASPGVLTAARAKVYVQGMVRVDSAVLSPGVLSVDGAVLRQAQIEVDSRYVGELGLLALELDNIVAGRPVTIRTSAALRSTQRVLASVGEVSVPAGYAALPYGNYRPPGFAPATQGLLFAGTDALWRWPLGAGAWQVPQSSSVPGLIDAAYAPDESEIFAIVPNAVLALDRLTLAARRQAALREPAITGEEFSTIVPTTAGALRFAADGRAFAALRGTNSPVGAGHGVGWLAGCGGAGGPVSDLTNGPCFADPGAEYLRDISDSTRGAGIARSANGATLAVSYPAGRSLLYRGISLLRVDSDAIPAGTYILGVDDAASWSVRDDGYLRKIGTEQGLDLRSRVPPGFVAGGFAITGKGQFALVYAYRMTDEAAGPRARDAQLLMFDLRTGLNALIGNPFPAAQVNLTDAVGCTAPLTTGESCQHQAHVLVAQGDKSAFVLGPRGVAAVSLPDLAASAIQPARSTSSFRFVPGRRPTGSPDGRPAPNTKQ